jgi:hypothetical protein
MAKPKKCKGTGQAKGFGCNKPLTFSESNGIKSYNSKYGLCPTCQYEWATTNDAGKVWFQKSLISNKKKKEKEENAIHREKKRSIDETGAMRLADMYFSRYIRVLYSDDNGYCTCYTCGTDVFLKELDNGHYQKREHKATRYHENNCRPQCKTCNGDTKHNGKQAEFRVHLSNEIGEEEVSEIERLANTTIKANSLFFRNIADSYRIKSNELQKIKKVKHW